MIAIYSNCGGKDVFGVTWQDAVKKLKRGKAKNLTGSAMHSDLVKVYFTKDLSGNGYVIAQIPGMRWWREDYWLSQDTMLLLPDYLFNRVL